MISFIKLILSKFPSKYKKKKQYLLTHLTLLASYPSHPGLRRCASYSIVPTAWRRANPAPAAAAAPAAAQHVPMVAPALPSASASAAPNYAVVTTRSRAQVGTLTHEFRRSTRTLARSPAYPMHIHSRTQFLHKNFPTQKLFTQKFSQKFFTKICL